MGCFDLSYAVDKQTDKQTASNDLPMHADRQGNDYTPMLMHI